MDKLALYLLESSAILAILYLLYVLVLRKETFFNLNRFFLLSIVICSLVFPFVSLDFNSSQVEAVRQPLDQLTQIRASYYEVIRDLSFDRTSAAKAYSEVAPISEQSSPAQWIMLLSNAFFLIYAIGVLLCLSKMIWSFWRINVLIRTNPHSDDQEIKLVRLSHPIAPFSFMNYVFVHQDVIDSPSFDQILAHEKVHVKQRHSLDLIFVQLCVALLWFNPVAWFLVRSLKTVHEYIADKEMIDKGFSLVDYQEVLLHQLISNHAYGMAHNFNLSSIKKRLAMMSIPQSGLTGKVKTLFTLMGALIFSALIVQCNAVLEEQSTTAQLSAGENLEAAPSATPYAEGGIDDRIVIVNIGMHSRADIAKMLNIINERQPRAVGVDAFFNAPKEDVQSDEMLADALASTENLVMAGRLRDGSIGTSWTNFSKGSVLNFVNLVANKDNRQVEIFRPSAEVEGQTVNAFALEMAQLYDPESVKAYEGRGFTKIDFSGNVADGLSKDVERFEAIDAQDVLERNFNTPIEGKIVLFGFLGEFLGQEGVLEDRFISPLNEDENPDMYGVVVHANIISQVLDGR